MGQRTDAAIAEHQREARIESATGKRPERLARMQALAFDLIKAVELERAGVRDGDGYWHGADPISGIISELSEELPYR